MSLEMSEEIEIEAGLKLNEKEIIMWHDSKNNF